MKSENKPSLDSGMGKQLLKVFVLQMMFISAITILGVYAAAKVVEDVMMKTALEGEARHFWKVLESNPDHALPNTDNLVGFLGRGGNQDSIPAEIRSLPNGFGRASWKDSNPLVLVQEKESMRLYLVFDEESVRNLSFYFGVVPLSLILVVLYISAWFAYRQSSKTISPVVGLAQAVKNFDFDNQKIEEMSLQEIESQPLNSEAEALVDALNSFTDEIKNLIQRERQFTRDASHELRTPLTIIQGSAEWLRDNGSGDEIQKDTIDRILRTVADMNELVTALLLLARGASDNLRLSVNSLEEVVERVIEEIQLTHKQKQVLFNLSVVSTEEIHGSYEGLYMVVSNLLRNAYNYTDENQVSIVIDGRQLEVRNRANEIKEGEIERFFEPFARGKSTTQQGEGLGLDIVKRLCDRFQWEISAQNEQRLGMIFRVKF